MLRRFLLVFLTLFTLLALVGCSLHSSHKPVTQPSGTSPKKGTKPYTIRGKTYYPLASAHGFREEGIASWYGKDFHGKKTANGETYDMYAMTAAHKILPLGTTVKVTHKKNGKSIIVRINDRGPFVASRVIDLSHTGAQKLDMIGTGTAPVIVETIGTVPEIQNGDIKGSFYVQVGAFANKGNAERLAATIRSEGTGARSFFDNHKSLWLVHVGPYPGMQDAARAGDSLKGRFPGNFITAE